MIYKRNQQKKPLRREREKEEFNSTSRPEWCDEEEEEEEEEGLEATSASGESATGMRSSRSLLAITIADFSSPIVENDTGFWFINGWQDESRSMYLDSTLL